ncbi:carboxypeptidase-like regulatory domain-containing protein [Ferruginibacter sp.]
MRIFFSTLLLLIFCNAVKAQVLVRGKVLDERSGTPVGNASVYINNTSIGTVTNASGEFSLNLKNTYTAELIISSVGYQLYTLHIDKDSVNFYYTVQLALKENTLKDVLIMNDATRQQWMKIFIENFLGITEEADNCVIENAGAVYFAMGENKNSMYAYADTPLVIINKQLGYKISFDLVEFSFDKIKNSTYFLGYSRYESISDKKAVIKRRKQNYFGSTMHFYRTLTTGDVKKAGYTISGIKKIPAVKDSTKSNKKNSGPVNLVYPITVKDMLQKDTVTGAYYITGQKVVMIKYDEEPHAKFYLSRKILVRGLDRFGFTAYITLLDDKVEVDDNGIIHSPLGIVYDGFWVYEKLANQLPFDYQPE